MMANGRPCALVTRRAVEVDLSRVVESTPTVNLRRPSTELVFICKLLRLDARRKLYLPAKTVVQRNQIPVRVGRDASCDSFDTRTHSPKCFILLSNTRT